MRKYLLADSMPYFKANLHSHSTHSDGVKTPAEMKEMYQAEGYSVLAITDHGKFVTHNDLTDDSFLMINGYEADITEPMDDPEYVFRRTCHMCILAPNPDVTAAPLPRECGEGYNTEHINELMRRCREEGFFVTYNHPTWSREQYPEYMSYKGMHCFEIINFNCIAGGTPEWNETKYDELLSRGDKLFCLAADDNHNTKWFNDSFGAYTMIGAERLDYEHIFAALMEGRFYASEAPEIKSVYYEDGVISVFTSPATSIRFNTATRRTQNSKAKDSLISSASFRIKPTDGYVRITVRDENGKLAHTRAFWLEDFVE